MADPLKLLREYIISNRPIKERDDYIIFGDTAFPKNVKTNHLVWSKKDEYYTLESLYFFYKKRSLVHTAYVKEAAAKNIQVVTRPDRKALEDYLTKDKLDSTFKPNIDHSAPIPASVHISRLQPSSASSTAAAEHHHNAEGPPDAKRARFEGDKNKEKERLLQILDASTRAAGASSEEIRGLSDDLTKEKIASLRSKALARKQKHIKNTEEDIDATAATAGSVAGVGGAESRRYVDAGQADLAQELASRERQWRTRTTSIEAASKNFGNSILPVLQALRLREEGGHLVPTVTSDSSVSRPSANDTNSKPGAPVRGLTSYPQQGYNRYDQERFRKEETEGFKIDTRGTYHGIELKLITEGAKPKQQQVTQSNSQVSTGAHGRSSGSRLPAVGAGYEPDSTGLNRPQKRLSRTPIIIIPAAGQSLITMYNARDLLQDLRYVSTEEKKAQGARRENEVLVQRQKEGNVTVSFRIIDNPLKLTPDEWDRVVAVFAQGPQWQFKGWPWNGNPVEIFEKIAAFHLKWDDVKVDPNIAKWSVNTIQLSRNKRHLDRALLFKFWDVLNKHIMKHKQHLRY